MFLLLTVFSSIRVVFLEYSVKLFANLTLDMFTNLPLLDRDHESDSSKMPTENNVWCKMSKHDKKNKLFLDENCFTSDI